LYRQKHKIMIQRIQSLFLLGVVLCMGLMLYFPLWEKDNDTHTQKMALNVYHLRTYLSDGIEPVQWKEDNVQPVYYVAVAASIAALIALYSIFLFRDRKFQMKLGAINALVIMITVVVAVFLIYSGENELGQGDKGSFYPGFYLPLGALIFNSLANRFIRKDDKLVRSVDRIR